MDDMFVTGSGLFITEATTQQCRLACKQWHYSKTCVAVVRVGYAIYENGRWIGCVVFANGIQSAQATEWGLDWERCIELVRVALDKHETEVTRIISLCIKFIAKKFPKLELILSYYDLSRGHQGGIFKGGNWVFVGETSAKLQVFFNGRMMSPRTLKCFGVSETGLERGHKYTKNKFVYPLSNNMRAKLRERSINNPVEEGVSILPARSNLPINAAKAQTKLELK